MADSEQLTIFKTAAPVAAPKITKFQSSPDGIKFFEQIAYESKVFAERGRKLRVTTAAQPMTKWVAADIARVRASLATDGLVRPAVDNRRQFPDTPLKPAKPYVPHSLERKQKTRCRTIVKRGQKLYSFADLWINWVQGEVAAKPWYFGVCQLDGDRCSTDNYAAQLKRQEAVAMENKLRNEEMEFYKNKNT